MAEPGFYRRDLHKADGRPLYLYSRTSLPDGLPAPSPSSAPSDIAIVSKRLLS